MKGTPDKKHRILALDVRAKRIGYAAFEMPTRLIDYGVTRFASRHAALPRLIRILHRTRPTVVVFRKVHPSGSRDIPRTRTIIRLTWLYARRSNIATAMVREKQVRDHFSREGATTKYKIASLLVKRFPELEWKLPPPRKAWKSERPNMSIFDAAALATTYIAVMEL